MQEKIFAMLESMAPLDSTEMALKSKLMDELELDSLDIMELIMKIEDEFKIQITKDEAKEIDTIEDIIDLVGKKQ